MKKSFLLCTILILSLLLCACSNAAAVPSATPAATASPAPTPTATDAATATETPAPTEKPLSPEEEERLEENKAVWREMHNRSYMEGRLLVPSVGIDVALFSWGTEPVGDYSQDKIIEIVRQDVVDHEDSALLYFDDPVGNIIADHSNQDFAKLTAIKVGDAAYILSGDRIVTLACVFTTDGINTGYGITDMDGGWHHDDADYVCYTCLEDWTHIQMVGFAMQNEEFLDVDWIDVGDGDKDDGSVTTMSLPAPASTETADNSTVSTPTSTAAPTPAQTAEPTAAPQPVQQPAAREPVYYDTIPGYDIYADADSTLGIFYSNGVDSYLG